MDHCLNYVFRAILRHTRGDGYTLEREPGGGGMARVFVARENALARYVVVKVLAPDLSASISAERFTREIAAAARLQQANIVPVLAAGTSGGVPHRTLQSVTGESLRACGGWRRSGGVGRPASTATPLGSTLDLLRCQ